MTSTPGSLERVQLTWISSGQSPGRRQILPEHPYLLRWQQQRPARQPPRAQRRQLRAAPPQQRSGLNAVFQNPMKISFLGPL